MHTNHNQQPIPSGYNAEPTAQEVIGDMNLSGKNVIVTGGYSGIGLETTRTKHTISGRPIPNPKQLTFYSPWNWTNAANHIRSVHSLSIPDLFRIPASGGI